MKRFILLIAIVQMFACAASLQQIPIDKRARVINATYNSTFKASIDWFTERGYLIKSMDKEMGIIDTDYKMASGIANALMGANMRTKVNALLSKIDKNQTKLVLTMVYEEKKAFGGWQASSMLSSDANKLYDTYFTEIEKRATNNSQ